MFIVVVHFYPLFLGGSNSGLMFKNNNIVTRIFERQIRTPAPSTSVNCTRRFYENLVPDCTIYNVDCPDHSFRKFTDDGQYLISFSRNHQDLIVYRLTWPSFSCKEEHSDFLDLPPKAKRFESFFTQLYCVSLASSNEFICKDFFLYLETKQFGLFATQTAQVYDAPATDGTTQGIPSIEKITFHLVRLEDGITLDEKVFSNDFVNLGHNMGVFLYDDLLAIMSLRYQTIHILQIRDAGNLVDVQVIGAVCREDDKLFLSSHAQASKVVVGNESSEDIQQALVNEYPSELYERTSSIAMIKVDPYPIWHQHVNGLDTNLPEVGYMVSLEKYKQPELPLNQGENEVQHQQQSPEAHTSFLSGIKQRLLSFMFRGIWNEESDESMQRVQSLKKRFYFHFQDYVDLIMLKVQFLDRHHLLIKFGSVDGGVSRNADHQPSFLAVYSMESTEIIAFYQNSADELYCLFEQFCDHFHATSRNTLYMNFISSHSNNIYALEQLRSIKNKASSLLQFAKKMLVSLPFSCQSQSPSPYFDQSLFRFDEKSVNQIGDVCTKALSRNTLEFYVQASSIVLKIKLQNISVVQLISAIDRHRQSTEHPIKFISRRHPNIFKFKIKPGKVSNFNYNIYPIWSRSWRGRWSNKEDLIIFVPPYLTSSSFCPAHASATICCEYSLPQLVTSLFAEFITRASDAVSGL
ncbi:hypothetical protein IFM89_037841 [Coptis chinensis]|uniref:Light-mediated development protein DET1 n=1 Tax=Coptis chinensis TaxID=261450 RepID=A0A835HMU2_9MAGN|nr:hypothetical protein IFM89_037841 [Coptis chinensis]